MQWINLKENKCPVVNCGSGLKSGRSHFTCICGFKIKKAKLFDAVKGKDSEAYKNKVREIERIKKFKVNQKIRKETILKNMKSEKLSNLERLYRRGRIGIEEYTTKKAAI